MLDETLARERIILTLVAEVKSTNKNYLLLVTNIKEGKIKNKIIITSNTVCTF
jgi:hypothetical protein